LGGSIDPPDLDPTDPIRGKGRSIPIVDLLGEGLKRDLPILEPMDLGAVGTVQTSFALDPKALNLRELVQGPRPQPLQEIQKGPMSVVLLDLTATAFGKEKRTPGEKRKGQQL
jgi:hypothetical protein